STAPDGKLLAVGDSTWPVTHDNTWWNWFTGWLRRQDNPTGFRVLLKSLPSGEQVVVLPGCLWPVISPDGKTLAVTFWSDLERTSVQLWDLPIRKPIGKILGLSALAAVATLLAFNGLDWLRRRRMRLKANLVPNSVPSTK